MSVAVIVCSCANNNKLVFVVAIVLSVVATVVDTINVIVTVWTCNS